MPKKINPILKAILPVAKGISDTLGSNCEVVVHDLSHPKTSIIAIYNNVVTERKIGDGIRDLVWSVLRSPNFKGDILANYQTISLKNKLIKSTTIIIRDKSNKPIGALCINFDLSHYRNMKKLFEEFIQTNNLSPPGDKVIEINNANIFDILNYLISQTIQESGIPVDKMTKKDKVKLVSFLDEKGVFKIKRADYLVANKLKVSKPTIYNYLNIVRSKKEAINNTLVF